MPPGLFMIENFITEEEEASFLKSINWDVSDNNKGKNIFNIFLKKNYEPLPSIQ